jgi:nicotinamide-nucleotide amidase
VLHACIISTGTELLLGSTMDSNCMFLSQKLSDLGVQVITRFTVGDNREQIKNAFINGFKLADLVISSGGLGPTLDDLTKEIACEVAGCKMELVEEEVKHLQEYFACRKRRMPEANLKQALFPREAIILKNTKGTAPGMYLKKDGKVLVLLPGPPREMQAMYLQEVESLLKSDFNLDEKQSASCTIKVMGPGESQVDEMLMDIINEPRGCSMALLAHDGEVHIKVTAEGENSSHSKQILKEISGRIENTMDRYVFGHDEETLVGVVAQLLVSKGKRLAVAESCSGGLLAQMITDLPGSSRYFWGSVTSYSNAAKIKFLGVNENTLESYGAVSQETAEEMARGILGKSGCDFSLAITGIAGPDGGTREKPVGLVYIALAAEEICVVKEMHFAGGREAIRMLSAKTALDMLRRQLQYGGI